MYSGHMIDELMEMVARAEDRALHVSLAVPEPAAVDEIYLPRFLFEPAAQQPALVGVA
jgi:hypothetical protein